MRRRSSYSTGFPTSALGIALMCLAFQGRPFAQTGAEILQTTGIKAGLCIHIGCGNGAMTSELTNGAIIVNGLATSEAEAGTARKTVQTAGKYGLVAIDCPRSLTTLPYAEHTANLVVADLDGLGAKAPTMAEIERITAPGGVMYVKQAGAWKKKVKAMPSTMDDWSHWAHGPDGNEVSKDVAMKPATNLKWHTGLQATGGNPAGIGPEDGLRIAGGKVFYTYMYSPGKDKKYYRLVGRDAFNGILLWEKPLTVRYKNLIIATNELLIYLPTKDSFLVALNSSTGETVRVFDKGLKFASGGMKPSPRINAVVHDGKLVEASGPDLRVLSVATAEVLWTYKGSDPFLNAPVVAPDENKLFVLSGRKAAEYGRQAAIDSIKSIVAFNLTTGQKLWTFTKIGGWPNGGSFLSQFFYADHALYLYAAENTLMHTLGENTEAAKARVPTMAKIKTSDGSLVWKEPINQSGSSGTTSSRTMVYRDGQLLDMLNWRHYEYDAATGKLIRPAILSGWERSHTWCGYGCEYQRATQNYMVISGGYVTKDDKVNRQFISRSTCGTGFFPAYGMLYCDDAHCSCWAMIRGQVAMSSDPLLIPIADGERLTKPAVSAQAGSLPQDGKLPAGTAAWDWLHTYRYNIDSNGVSANGMVIPDPTTKPVSGGGMTYIAHKHLHMVEARTGSTTTWAFTTGGRISEPPVYDNGRLFVGCHDGYLYALDAKTGKLLWKFMAAPYDERFVTFGQVESRWPVMGQVMHGGKICASAGFNPELGGGIYVWGLDPSTGVISWKVNVTSPRTLLPANTAKSLHSNKMLNGRLVSESGQLKIVGFNFRRTYTFLVDPVAWNGKSIDPKTNGTVATAPIDPSNPSTKNTYFIPEISVARRELRVGFGAAPPSQSVVLLYDVAGRLIMRKSIGSAATAVIPLGSLSGGTYTAYVKWQGKSARRVLEIF